MRTQVIAVRYAQALLAFASGFQAQDRVLEQVKWYEQVASVSVSPLLANPKIPREVKEGLIARLFKDDPNKILFYFIQMLIRKGRIAYLKAIFSIYPKQVELANGITGGTLSVAYPIADSVVESLKTKLEHVMRQKLALKIIQDASLLGGFILTTGSELVDASLRRVLADLGDKLRSVPNFLK